jgi:flagellin
MRSLCAYRLIKDEERKERKSIMASITINTNLASLTAQHNLSIATSGMNTAMERLTTGYRINSGKDDAAGSAVSTLMEAQISGYDVAESNASMGMSLLDTAEGVLDIVGDYLQRIRDLTEQAANGTYGQDSLNAINSEITARLEEVDRISKNCEFNGRKMMLGEDSTDPQAIKNHIYLQVGLYSGEDSQIKLDKSLFSSAQVKDLFTNYGDDGAFADVAAVANKCTGTTTAAGMLDTIDNVIKEISKRTTTLGAAQNRIDSAIESIGVQSENITSSLSTLRDADIAEESSKYIQAQILQQAASTLLSTANQTPSIALNLL